MTWVIEVDLHDGAASLLTERERSQVGKRWLGKPIDMRPWRSTDKLDEVEHFHVEAIAQIRADTIAARSHVATRIRLLSEVLKEQGHEPASRSARRNVSRATAPGNGSAARKQTVNRGGNGHSRKNGAQPVR